MSIDAAPRNRTRTVGHVADLAKVSARTLHHYDEIGLVRPSARTDAGYRLYDDGDLERLQQVLFYRELGFRLDDIRGLMTAPDFDRGRALREQRRLLRARAAQVERMLAAVDAAIDAHEKGTPMNSQDMFEVFGDFDPSEYEDEVRERWGDTEAYRQSVERTSRYTKEDWQRAQAEADEVARRFATLMERGEPATGEDAIATAEAHRRHIGDRFYDCSHEMHAGLGEMYVADQRFTEYWDRYAPGLARYVRDAIVANAEQSRPS